MRQQTTADVECVYHIEAVVSFNCCKLKNLVKACAFASSLCVVKDVRHLRLVLMLKLSAMAAPKYL